MASRGIRLHPERTMVVLLDRRVWVQSVPLFASLFPDVSVKQAASIICERCPTEFRRSVLESGVFLYRGESVAVPEILCPLPDLLNLETYNDKAALEYFQHLELRLKTSTARPSTGHIGTANRSEAALWGEPVSVWPLGDKIHYAWPENRSLFWPWSDENTADTIKVNENLTMALALHKEIHFSTTPIALQPLAGRQTSTCFLAVPSRFDLALWNELSAVHHGLN